MSTFAVRSFGEAVLDPNSFHPHPQGPWEERMRPIALAAIKDALARYWVGDLSEAELRADKNKRGIKYWLWYMHHPHSQRWKYLGRPYWSVDAFRSWRRQYLATAAHMRIARDGAPAQCTLPNVVAGKDALRHEHVVPQKVLLDRLLDGADPEAVLGWNVGAVITCREDDLLKKMRASHPDPSDPWLRYADTGIQMVPNPQWRESERAALQQHGLLYEGDVLSLMPDELLAEGLLTVADECVGHESNRTA